MCVRGNHRFVQICENAKKASKGPTEIKKSKKTLEVGGWVKCPIGNKQK